MDSIAGGQLTGVQRDEIMQQLQREIAVANVQETLVKISKTCFEKCINKPGTSFDSSEQKCVAMCMDRFLDSFNAVTKSYTQRLQRELNNT